MSNKKDFIEIASQYIKSMEGVSSYIIAEEGFLVKWGGKITKREAEEIAALIFDLITASEKISSKPSLVIVSSLKNENIGGIKLDNTVIVVRGSSHVISPLLMNLAKKYREEKLLCPHCKRDILLSVFSCPHCRANIPINTEVCPRCGKEIKILRCPYCKKPITYRGRKISYKHSKIGLALGGLLIATPLLTIPLVSFEGITKIIVISIDSIVAASGAFLLLKLKEPREEETVS